MRSMGQATNVSEGSGTRALGTRTFSTITFATSGERRTLCKGGGLFIDFSNGHHLRKLVARYQ